MEALYGILTVLREFKFVIQITYFRFNYHGI